MIVLQAIKLRDIPVVVRHEVIGQADTEDNERGEDITEKVDEETPHIMILYRAGLIRSQCNTTFKCTNLAVMPVSVVVVVIVVSAVSAVSMPMIRVAMTGV